MTENVGLPIPLDVLGVVFKQYVANDPLNRRQPDISGGPMLLCQVSSIWRLVALRTPDIWTHLHHVSKVIMENNQRVIRSKDLNFLRWWYSNLGSLSPSLRISLDVSALNLTGHSVALEDVERYRFLIDAMRSAQYLDLDHYWSTALQEMLGDRPLECPRLETLIMRQGTGRQPRLNHSDPTGQNGAYDTHRFIPIKASNRSIRQIYVEDLVFVGPDVTSILPWSQITHMVLSGSVHLTFDAWFLILRQSTALVSGEFAIHVTDTSFHPLPTSTLPSLRKLSIFTYGHALPAPILSNLHLPSVTSLRLDIHWMLSVQEIMDTLRSTPNLRELQLGPDSPWDGERCKAAIFPGYRDTVTSLWKTVPHLRFIHVHGKTPEDHLHTMDLIDSALNSPWLDLHRVGNQIMCLEFGRCGGRGGTVLEGFVKKVQPRLPAGVKVQLRAADAPQLWYNRKSGGASLTKIFDDLMFLEDI